MITRKIAMTAGAAAAAALVATGVTYASAPEVPSAAAATPTVNQAAPTGGDSGQAKGNGAAAGGGANGAVAGNGGDNGGRGGDNGGRDGGGNGGDNGGRGGDNGGRGGDDGGRGGDDGGRDGGGRGGDDDGGRDGGGRGGRGYEGRIDFNERSYSAQSWGCITVVSGLGSRSFNVRNDSRRTVEVFRGATCDNGSPVATVGPWSTTNGVVSHYVHGGVKVRDGVVGSFRVVRDRHGW
ncbi:hypothetical protein GFH48_06890 [Streptomyces fagopyri]|uniref:Uncharacterized protein n=2 Tax=Streptomyces fagopyri TaxID=2662397 RepID=A0A5Q0L894_9ACTN|nr:hypothetical protein GFH48_06890 [Streptomyces fagopyri]